MLHYECITTSKVYNNFMTKIIKITTQHQFEALNLIKREIAKPSIELYPLLYQECEQMYSQPFVTRLLAGNTLVAYGYFQEDILLGYIIIEWMKISEKGALKAREFAYIHDLGTLPSARHQGIATSLLLYVEQLMNERQIVDIELAVHIDFQEAIHLYEKLGYKPRTMRFHKAIK
jgi:ribosomal protein S18 acetylase RimI-like enzyme